MSSEVKRTFKNFELIYDDEREEKWVVEEQNAGFEADVQAFKTEDEAIDYISKQEIMKFGYTEEEAQRIEDADPDKVLYEDEQNEFLQYEGRDQIDLADYCEKMNIDLINRIEEFEVEIKYTKEDVIKNTSVEASDDEAKDYTHVLEYPIPENTAEKIEKIGEQEFNDKVNEYRLDTYVDLENNIIKDYFIDKEDAFTDEADEGYNDIVYTLMSDAIDAVNAALEDF